MDERQPFVSELSRRRKFNLLNDHLKPGSRVLEVGTGDGWFAKRLRESGHDTVTIDLESPTADVKGNILNWRKLGLQEKSFDAVVALEVIEHVDCLNDLRLLCKDGGLIMLSSPHPSWDWSMRMLEFFHLTQKRTSPHNNLTDFSKIDLTRVVFKRPMLIHQVALFRNIPTRAMSAAA